MVKPTTEKQQLTQRSESESKFKGVRKRKWGRWVSEIRLPNCRQRIWLGSYDTPEKAAKAFDAASFCLRGTGAKFNFPNNPPQIPTNRSLTPSEIQEIAARFANEETSEHSTSSFLPSHDQLLDYSSSSPSSSINSEETVPIDDNDLTIDWSFLNSTGVEVGGSDFSNFGWLDEFPQDFLKQEIEIEHCEENGDNIFFQEPLLWNF